MPKDYLEYVSYNKINNQPLQQGNNVQTENDQAQIDLYRARLEQDDALLNDYKKNIFGHKKNDSDKMVDVKNSLRTLHTFFQTPMLEEKVAFEEQLTIALEYYKNLITSCDKYLTSRSKAESKKEASIAHRRWELVNRTKNNAIREYQSFTNRAKTVYEDSKNIKNSGPNARNYTRPLWINVLMGVRTTQLDLTKNNIHVDMMGGNTSSVLKVSVEGNKVAGFIKEDESVVLPTTFSKNYIAALKDGKQHAYLEKLAHNLVVRDFKDFYSFLADKKIEFTPSFIKENSNTFIKTINNYLSEYGFDKIDSKYNKLTIDYFILYTKHFQSYYVATENAYISKKNLNLTNRNVASYRIAELLGISDIIAASRRIQYIGKDNVTHKGIISEEAKGIPLSDVYRKLEKKNLRNPNFSPKALIQLNSLNIFDRLVYQIDRNAGNVFVEYDEKNNLIKSIKGIDNDMCLGTEKTVKENPHGILHDLSSFGNFRLVHIDSKLYNSVMCLSDEMITAEVNDLLDETEITALKERFTSVKDELKKALEKNKTLLVTKDDLDNEVKADDIKNSILKNQTNRFTYVGYYR